MFQRKHNTCDMCAILLVIILLIIPSVFNSTASSRSASTSNEWIWDIDIINKTVETQTVATCPEDMFQCRNGQCIFQNRTCNYFPDCSDNSDEDYNICAGRFTGIKNGEIRELTSIFYDEHQNLKFNRSYSFYCDKNYEHFPRIQEAECQGNKCSGEVPQCLCVSNSSADSSSTNSTCDSSWTSKNSDTINKTVGTQTIATCAEDMFQCRNGQCVFQNRTCNYLSDCSDNSDEDENMCASWFTPIENGNIRVLSGVTYDEHQNLKIRKEVIFFCHENYASFPVNDAIICAGSNCTGDAPQCLLTCPPRFSELLDTTCEKNGTKLDCAKPLVEGTTASMKCKPRYDEQNPFNRPAVECDTVCGQVIPQGKVLIINGTRTKFGKFPWHVGIYKKTVKNVKYQYQCGGSIINPKIVLSAAHCLTNESGTLFNVNEYSVAAGKYYRDYDSQLDRFVQKRQVEVVHIPGYYQGLLSAYSADIALVILTVSFELTTVIRPICVDWNNVFENDQLKSSSFGQIAGWGYTKEGESLAKSLKQLTIPYIERYTCVKVVPKYFIRFVTPDKFCAGYKNGSSVCNGDSGGGLVFYREEDKKYYIRGLVSNGPIHSGTCDSHQYGAFTKISHYLEYIKPIVEKHSGKCRRLYDDAKNETTVAKCSNGKWDIPPITCIPECGETVPQDTLLIVGGSPVKRNNFPWHVGIYRRDILRGVFNYLCGGSIISVKVVITGAYCFFRGDKTYISDTFVAAGKFYKDYNHPLDIIAQQRKIIELEYKKEEPLYWQVSLVIVELPFILNNFVRPVCIDWDHHFDYTDTNTGTITDWTLKFYKEEATEELQQVTVPFFSFDTCKKYYKTGYRGDLLCTVFMNDSAVCFIRNGGGLVSFNMENRRYYLQGIVNVRGEWNEECNHALADISYIPVSKHLDYIKEIELKYRL